jgi:hypothetical protein
MQTLKSASSLRNQNRRTDAIGRTHNPDTSIPTRRIRNLFSATSHDRIVSGNHNTYCLHFLRAGIQLDAVPPASVAEKAAKQGGQPELPYYPNLSLNFLSGNPVTAGVKNRGTASNASAPGQTSRHCPA